MLQLFERPAQTSKIVLDSAASQPSLPEHPKSVNRVPQHLERPAQTPKSVFGAAASRRSTRPPKSVYRVLEHLDAQSRHQKCSRLMQNLNALCPNTQKSVFDAACTISTPCAQTPKSVSWFLLQQLNPPSTLTPTIVLGAAAYISAPRPGK